MKVSSRWRYVVSLVLALVGGVAVARSQWVTDMGLDFWSLPRLRAQLEQTKTQAEKLEEVCERAKFRLQIKDELIKDLIDGRASFAQTVEGFRMVNDPDSGLMIKMKHVDKTTAEHEMLARNVMLFVESWLREAPGSRSDVLPRIRSEMREFVGRRT